MRRFLELSVQGRSSSCSCQWSVLTNAWVCIRWRLYSGNVSVAPPCIARPWHRFILSGAALGHQFIYQCCSLLLTALASVSGSTLIGAALLLYVLQEFVAASFWKGYSCLSCSILVGLLLDYGACVRYSLYRNLTGAVFQVRTGDPVWNFICVSTCTPAIVSDPSVARFCQEKTLSTLVIDIDAATSREWTPS